MTLDPRDPDYAWMYAAELAALLQDLSEWYRNELIAEVAELADSLTQRVYEGGPTAELLSDVSFLFELLDEGWYLLGGDSPPREPIRRARYVRYARLRPARDAALSLRNMLDDDDQPRAA